MTQNELDSYLNMTKEILQACGEMSMSEVEEIIDDFKKELDEGVDEGIVQVCFDSANGIIVTMCEEFICKMMNKCTKYFSVVIPQLMSIVKLTKNLIEESEEIAEQLAKKYKKEEPTDEEANDFCEFEKEKCTEATSSDDFCEIKKEKKNG